MEKAVVKPSVQGSVAFGGEQDRREFLANAAIGLVSARRSQLAAATSGVRSGER